MSRLTAAAAVMLAAILFAEMTAAARASTATKASITLNERQGLPGSVVTGHGEGFDHWSLDALPDRIGGEDHAAVVNPGPVRVHWNSLERAVVWEGPSGLDGRISFSFRVPADAAAGRYTVVATQTGYDGEPTGGTPTRASFEVVLPAPAARHESPPAGDGAPERPGEMEPALSPPSRSRAAGEGRREPAGGTGRNALDERGGRRGAADPAGTGTATATSPPRDRAGRGRLLSATSKDPAAEVRPPIVAPQPAHRSVPAAASAAAGADVPWYVLPLALLAGLVGGAGGAFVLLRRSAGDPAPAGRDLAPPTEVDDALDTADPTELELQRLLAQERGEDIHAVAGR